MCLGRRSQLPRLSAPACSDTTVCGTVQGIRQREVWRAWRLDRLLTACCRPLGQVSTTPPWVRRRGRACAARASRTTSSAQATLAAWSCLFQCTIQSHLGGLALTPLPPAAAPTAAACHAQPRPASPGVCSNARAIPCRTIVRLLRCVCFHCWHFRTKTDKARPPLLPTPVCAPLPTTSAPKLIIPLPTLGRSADCAVRQEAPPAFGGKARRGA